MGPILKDILSKAPIYEFLADRDGNYQGQEGEALNAVSRKYFESQLNRLGAKCAWIGLNSADAGNLVQKNQDT